MAKINLRPWREELRAEKQKQFVTSLVAAVLISGALGFGWLNYVQSEIEYQNSRNTYVQTAIKQLDKKIAEIKDLKERKRELVAKMEVIQGLQGKRPVIVRVFDELVKTLPDGLYYHDLGSKSGRLTINGSAESNNRISALMRTFERSEWFGEPNLSVVQAAAGPDGMNRFNLSVPLTTPEDKKKQK